MDKINEKIEKITENEEKIEMNQPVNRVEDKIEKMCIRDRVNRLKEIGLEVVIPKGAFYVFPSIKQFNMKSEEFALKLLKEEKVACVPGSAFGKGGEGYLRLSYCYSDEELEEGLKRIERFIKTLNK